MTGRLTLADLRWLVLEVLDDEWRTPTYLADRLGVGQGNTWYRLALVLERLAGDGEAELRVSGRVRRYRRAGASRSRAAMPSADPLGDELARCIAAHGPLTTSELQYLARRGWDPVAATLRTDRRFVRVGRGNRGRWQLAGNPARSGGTRSHPPPRFDGDNAGRRPPTGRGAAT